MRPLKKKEKKAKDQRGTFSRLLSHDGAQNWCDNIKNTCMNNSERDIHGHAATEAFYEQHNRPREGSSQRFHPLSQGKI
jgi:hypothetical protein